MKDLVCIVCPKGCRLKVDENNGYKVTGNGCPRGEIYGREELVNPVRVVTSTVKLKGGLHPRLSVKTKEAIAKGLVFDVMKELDAVELVAPVACGDVVIANVCDSGVDIVATRNS